MSTIRRKPKAQETFTQLIKRDPLASGDVPACPQLITRSHAAQLLNFSPRAIDKLIIRQHLRPTYLNGKIFVHVDDVLRLVEIREFR